MRRKERPLISYLIDSREPEETRYRFLRTQRDDLDYGGVIVGKLEFSDYSCELDAKPLPVMIERKSLPDLYACVGRERERFERELEGLRAGNYKSYLLIEADLAQVAAGYERSQVTGRAAIASVLCWSIKFNINPIFCGNWKFGNAVCRRILEEFCAHWSANGR